MYFSCSPLHKKLTLALAPASYQTPNLFPRCFCFWAEDTVRRNHRPRTLLFSPMKKVLSCWEGRNSCPVKGKKHYFSLVLICVRTFKALQSVTLIALKLLLPVLPCSCKQLFEPVFSKDSLFPTNFYSRQFLFCHCIKRTSHLPKNNPSLHDLWDPVSSLNVFLISLWIL